MVQSFAVIQFESDSPTETNIEIRSLLGEIIWSENNITIPKGYSEKTIDFSNLSGQIYFIKLEIDGEVVMFKVLKQ